MNAQHRTSRSSKVGLRTNQQAGLPPYELAAIKHPQCVVPKRRVMMIASYSLPSTQLPRLLLTVAFATKCNELFRLKSQVPSLTLLDSRDLMVEQAYLPLSVSRGLASLGASGIGSSSAAGCRRGIAQTCTGVQGPSQSLLAQLH